MRRFARLSPGTLQTVQARSLDPIALKIAWSGMSIYAEEQINWLADTLPDTPIGVAFIDADGNPGWIGDNPDLRTHYPSVRACLPYLHLDGSI